MRLIDADAITYWGGSVDRKSEWLARKKVIDEMPTIDAVPRKAFDGILWENDVMRKQLADIGKPFGEKMDDVVKVVRCKDCKHMFTDFVMDGKEYKRCEMQMAGFHDDWYCADGERKADGT